MRLYRLYALPPSTCSTVTQIACALRFLHAGHLVHLDVKPTNVLLLKVHYQLLPPSIIIRKSCAFNPAYLQGKAQLSDLGLVKVRNKFNPDSSSSCGGSLRGTASYIGALSDRLIQSVMFLLVGE